MDNQCPGLCTGLSIDVEDLGKELPESDYPFLNALHRKGIAALLEAAEGHGFKPAKSAYASKCELCIEARTFLANKVKVLTKDLNPRQFYSEYE